MPVAAKESLFGAVFLLIMVASLASQDLIQDGDSVDVDSIANKNDEQLLHKHDGIADLVNDSDVKALRLIDQFPRRHEPDGDFETRVESKALGTGAIVAKKCLELLTKAMIAVFPGRKQTPHTTLLNIIWTMQVNKQKDHLIAYRKTLEHLIGAFERIAGDNTSERYRTYNDVVNFHKTLTKDRCDFMMYEHFYSSADYFNDFAVIQTAVTETVIEIYPKRTEYKDVTLINDSKDFINYAKLVEQKLEYSDEIRQLFKLNKAYWMNLLSAAERDVIHKHGAIRNGETVSFRHSGMSRWLGCYGKGKKCGWATCPGEDNPMKKENGQYKCWGEKFSIQAIYPNNGYIKNCDKVGILFGLSSNGKYYWLSGNCKKGGVCQTEKSTCPGASATSIAKGKCNCEVWTLHTYGKACGEIIYDRDVINFRGGNTGSYKPLNSRSTDVWYENYGHRSIQRADTFKYQIFRTYVDQYEYAKFLPCR
jgi:hypothetical protein